MRAHSIVSLCVFTALAVSQPAWSQQPTPGAPSGGPVKSGVQGRVVIAPQLRDAARWPVDEKRAKLLRGSGWVRRPSGRGPVTRITEANPPLQVVIGGLNHRDATARKLVVKDRLFQPPQLVTTRAHPLEIENQQGEAITVVVNERELKIEPGQTAKVESLGVGDHVVRVKELSFASASLAVLDEATLLELDAAGILKTLPMEPGEYELAFYHGARLLHSRELTVEGGKFVAIDATVSENGVVTVSLKAGGLQVVGPGGGP